MRISMAAALCGCWIDIVSQLQAQKPRFDYRTTLAHFAYATRDQLRQMQVLGMVVSATPISTLSSLTRMRSYGRVGMWRGSWCCWTVRRPKV